MLATESSWTSLLCAQPLLKCQRRTPTVVPIVPAEATGAQPVKRLICEASSAPLHQSADQDSGHRYLVGQLAVTQSRHEGGDILGGNLVVLTELLYAGS